MIVSAPLMLGYVADQVQAWYYAWPEFFRYLIVQFIPIAIGMLTYWQAARARKAVYPNHGSSMRDAVNRMEKAQGEQSKCTMELQHQVIELQTQLAELHAKNEIWHG